MRAVLFVLFLLVFFVLLGSLWFVGYCGIVWCAVMCASYLVSFLDLYIMFHFSLTLLLFIVIDACVAPDQFISSDVCWAGLSGCRARC